VRLHGSRVVGKENKNNKRNHKSAASCGGVWEGFSRGNSKRIKTSGKGGDAQRA